METMIDLFGQVVIPKRVREGLRLQAGESLVIEERDEGILLRPVYEGAPLKHKGRVLVFAGQATGEPGNLARRARDERLHKLAGRWRR